MKVKTEKVPVSIFKDNEEASVFVANEIAKGIKQKQAEKKNFVLGLATGSTPVGVYEELIRLHREESLSFKNVITFNLDEYYPMLPDSLQSYVRFMKEYLFDHIDIPKENIHIPDGTVAKEKIEQYCQLYEQKIKEAGGIDLQLLGIGRTGHIGFNEPGSTPESLTRIVTLDEVTRIDAASDFFGEENVPKKAITMGIGTILTSKRVILMAWGETKAFIIKKALEEKVTDEIPSSYLQLHTNALVVLDEASASELTTVKTPWLTGQCKWDDALVKKAVVWLSLTTQKPILKLDNKTYMAYGMGDLLNIHGSAYNLNIKIFNQLQHTITGWPGGKNNADDTNRPERSKPFPKRVIIFSPHPDDDVISMGGTFSRLIEQGHEVHVAYQTSGNIAVFDDDAIRHVEFLRDLNDKLEVKAQSLIRELDEALVSIEKKTQGAIDSPTVLEIKGSIRRSEAKAACRYLGVPPSQIHFLDLPFYETGTVRKKPLGNEDVEIVADMIRKVKPHQIYAAGDLSDPHGTHRVCLKAVYNALETLKKEKWIKDCYLWLYRGAWQEWEIEKIEMAVPLSPEELLRKRKSIFKHESQKDEALFPGNDPREFWIRAEDRNKKTAKLYNDLGLAEYEAMEAFVRYKF
ncbi:MAG TPA: glucosamine-6-phosphate deaminase [Cytophagaceae bacterium]|jgi:glucosamine-6-phosphate deaminase